MDLQLIRNATLVLDYGGVRFLIDPDLAPQHERPSFTGAERNPTVDLPMSLDDVLAGIDAVIVSHLHADHFDTVAKEVLPKSIPLFCQLGDAQRIEESGFSAVQGVQESITYAGVTIERLAGHHGTGDVEQLMGQVSGFMFSADNEPTLYWAGDTVLCDEVESAIKTYQPDVIVTHSGGAMWKNQAGEPVYIIMDALQTVQVAQQAPDSTIVATHMEALDHCTTTRLALHEAASQAGISATRLLIPVDGDTLTL